MKRSNNRGVGLTELMMGVVVIAGLTLPIVSMFGTFQSQMEFLGGKANSKLAATKLLMLIANFGKYASACRNPDSVTLECDLERTVGTIETVYFTFDAATQTLTFERKMGAGARTLVWVATDITRFTVCNGSQMRIGVCNDGEANLLASPMLSVGVPSISSYFRMTLEANQTYQRARVLHNDGGLFTVQTGFSSRNANSTVNYGWMPLGGGG